MTCEEYRRKTLVNKSLGNPKEPERDMSVEAIIARTEFGECTQCHNANGKFPKIVLSRLGGICPPCAEANEKRTTELKQSVKYSQDVNYKKVRGLRERNVSGARE